MSKAAYISLIVASILLFCFAVGSIVGGAVCLNDSNKCNINQATSGGLLGAGVSTLIFSIIMLVGSCKLLGKFGNFYNP